MRVSRREALGLGGSALIASCTPTLSAASSRGAQRRVLRVAHITDIHVQNDSASVLGMERCLEDAQSHNPDLIITGGDMVMDVFNVDGVRAKAQWDMFQKVLRANIATPIRHCIGNHDIWGWGSPSCDSNQPKYGKRMALDRLEMDRPYYSFSEGGWHFAVLDSVERKRIRGYQARLDQEQYEWLADDLERTPNTKPICIVSHIPILSTCAFFHGDNEASGRWVLPEMWMHTDARRLKELFKQHPNVKLCISGHIHLVDTVKYLGVNYLCNGSACGAWWRGPHQECKNGYALLDLYADGSFRRRYMEYAWKA